MLFVCNSLGTNQKGDCYIEVMVKSGVAI